MAEAERPQLDPISEGRRIARDYLSKLGWAREWKRVIWTEVPMAWQKNEMEDKRRRADEMEIEAEAGFSSAFERLRKETSESARQTLRAIYDVLKERKDLGFIGTRILARLREMTKN